jgi:hypothetical protein
MIYTLPHEIASKLRRLARILTLCTVPYKPLGKIIRALDPVFLFLIGSLTSGG